MQSVQAKVRETAERYCSRSDADAGTPMLVQFRVEAGDDSPEGWLRATVAGVPVILEHEYQNAAGTADGDGSDVWIAR